MNHVTSTIGEGTPQGGDQLDEKVHERRWLILCVLCLSLVMIVMDNTIVNVAIPSLIRDFDASNSEIQWIMDSYVLVFAGLLLTTGSLSDKLGRKGTLQVGIVVFSLGSIASALAASTTQLIITRGIMGIGGALIMPSTLSILMNVFRDPRERGRAIAVWAGFSGVGLAVGPITGGFLIEHFDWSAVFWVNVPLACIALALGAMFLPTSRNPNLSKLDPLGAALSILGLASLLFGIIEGPVDGWWSPKVTIAFAVALVSLATFVQWERRTASPMLDLSVFGNARFTAASSTITLVFFALFGSLFLMTQYWQLVHNFTPLQAGVRLIPHALTMMLVAPLSARAVERLGTKRVVMTGLLTMATGVLLLSTIHATSSYPRVITYFVVMACGIGMTMAPATESVMGALPRSKAGVGSAVNDTTRQVGGALGVAIVGSIVSSVYRGRIADLARGFDLPRASVEHAQASLGSAQLVASEMATDGARFLSGANRVFVESMAVGMRISVFVILVAAFTAWRFLPARAHDVAHGVDTDPRAGEDEAATLHIGGVAGDTPASATPAERD